ncbi:MAG: S8 family serine peptidase [Armatimonadota bacterium]
MANLLGAERRKIHPKLRMIANGSTEVNAARAEQSAAVAVDKSMVSYAFPVLRGDDPVMQTMNALRPPKRPELQKLAGGVLVNVFIETQDVGKDLPQVLQNRAHRANLVAATVQLVELPEIARHRHVLHIDLGDPLATPTPEISHKSVEAPDSSRWRFGSPAMHRDGSGVLIGIIDVQGFDFAHPDFLDGNKTRFVRIWDQGGAARPSPHKQDRARYGEQFDFGAEFRQEHLSNAIASAAKLKLPPQEIEQQSQMAPSSHGTHVASIAAGNLGICRKAMIAGVLISLPEDDNDRRKSFYDSTRIAHAVDYLFLLADELGVPVSINISLGTNGHAHDGSSAISRWIDASLAVPGRSVCVAAGNAGQEVAAFPGDIGYIMGRIHTSGKVPGRYLHKDIEWSVVGNGIDDMSENELEVWYGAQDRFAVSVRPPWQGADWIGPIEPREYVENFQLPNGSFISIYNELYHPANGSNYIALYLSPYFGSEGVIGLLAGQWTVRLHGRDVRDGGYHGWIERDDPRRLGRVGPREAWRFPSFFTDASNVDDSSVGSLACGRRVIAVANLNETEERVHITSSQGPTRDNRSKPDVAAPGTAIVAANGFAGSGDLWVEMTGTSMASPFVAGVAGLMLACERRLTAAQIEAILHRTSRPLPGKAFEWTNDSGFGMIHPLACLEEAEAANKRTERET